MSEIDEPSFDMDTQAVGTSSDKPGRGRLRNRKSKKEKKKNRTEERADGLTPDSKFRAKTKVSVEQRDSHARKVKGTPVVPFQLIETIRSRSQATGKRRKSAAKNKEGTETDSDDDIVGQPFYDDPLPTPRRPSGKTADWDSFLLSGKNLLLVPPVDWFKHAPLTKIWKDVAVKGLIVEISNPHVPYCPKPIYWYAKIVHYAGYKALVQFEQPEGFEPDCIAWMSFCSKVPKPVGYCRKTRILMRPPKQVYSVNEGYTQEVIDKYKNPDGIMSVRPDHGEFISSEVKKCQKFILGDVMEVLDRDHISKMRLARVTSIVGDRIHVSYVFEPEEDDPGYWFNVNSDYIHPIGWSKTVGLEITGVPSRVDFGKLPPEYFPKYPPEIELVTGQMLEVRHPQLPHVIVGAKIARVLNYGYFIVEISTNKQEKAIPVRFIYHVTSHYIFPCGFCQTHNIPLVPPYDPRWYGPFNWVPYFLMHKRSPAPLHLVPKRPRHNFQPGMKLEAICILRPTYLGPATIRRVCGHLLEVSFDGFPKTSICPHEIWFSAESPNIYPLGYAEMVTHEFSGRVDDPNPRKQR